MKLLRIFAVSGAVLCVFVALALVAGYATSPRWLAALAQRTAAQQGVDISELKLGYPGSAATHIESLAVQLKSVRLKASGIDVAYSYDTLRARRIRSLHIAKLEVALLPKSPLDKTPSSFDVPADIDALWRALPIGTVQIDALHVTATDPDVALHGNASLTDQLLTTHLIAERPTLAVGTTAMVRLQRNGKLLVSLTRPPAASSIGAHAVINASIEPASSQPARSQPVRSASADKRAGIAPQQLALDIDAQLPTDLLSLATAAAGISTTAGNADAKLHTHLPWPLPKALDANALAALVKAVDLQGDFAIDWTGALPHRFTNGHARFAGSATRRGDSVFVQLKSGSLFTAQLIMTSPLALFGQKIDSHIELNAAQPLRVELSPQQFVLTGEVRGRVGEPSAALFANVTGVRVPLQVRAGSTLGDDAVAHIQWRTDLPKTTFGRFTAIGIADLHMRGHIAQLHIAPRAKITLQALGDWSLATTNITNPTSAFDVTLDTNDFSYSARKLALTVQMPKAKVGEQLVTLDTGKLSIEALSGHTGGRIDTQLSYAAQATTPRAAPRATPRATPHAGTPQATSEPLMNNQKFPFSVAGNVNLANDIAHAVLTLALPKSSLQIPFVLTQDLAHHRGTMHIDTTFTVAKPLMNATFDRWRGVYDLDRGDITLRADLQWHAVSDTTGAKTKMAASGRIATDKVTAHYADYSFKGLTLRGDWSVPDVDAGLNGITVTHGTLQLQEVFVGTSVKQIDAPFSYADGVFVTPGLRASVFGGHASTSALSYVVKTGAAQFNVIADGLALDQLLALEGEDISGTGTLDGTLPVTLTNNQPVIHGGVVKSRPPGGTIAYKNAANIATYAQRPGLEFVISALEDFHFHTLDAGVEYGADNGMKLSVRLYGHNPKVEAGREIHYNLNVSENIVDLLRSLRAASDLTDRLEQRLSR